MPAKPVTIGIVLVPFTKGEANSLLQITELAATTIRQFDTPEAFKLLRDLVNIDHAISGALRARRYGRAARQAKARAKARTT